MDIFDLQPVLKGKFLSLRPLVASDFEALYAVSSDPLLWEMHPERLRYKREVFEQFFAAALESKGALLALDSVTGAVIGSSRYCGLNRELGLVEVGYTFLARSCWGKGHNFEMKKLMLDHAFQHVSEVHFYIGEKNLRSRRAIEKIGARLIERIERQPKEGARYVATKYGLQKEFWQSKR